MANLTLTEGSSLSAAVLRGGTYTGGLLYCALFTVTPTSAGGGTEASYTGYARQPFRTGAQLNTDQFTVNNGSGMAQNSQVLTFPANAGTSQTVVGMAIFDAVTGGNMLMFSALSASKSIDPADVPSFPAGSIQITWS